MLAALALISTLATSGQLAPAEPAAPPERVAARLGGVTVVRVPGDHVTAPMSNEFVDLIAAVAREAS